MRSVCRPSGEKFPGTTSIEARGAAGALLGAKKGLRKAKKAGMSAEMLEEFRIQDVIFNIYIYVDLNLVNFLTQDVNNSF